MLVPQDIRERKGAFFTPRKWVELSQKYLADVLGENWQDEYYVWDCAAGTGNLLAGLTNKYNIWASTLDQADLNVMQDRIDHGANLLKSHVFQFDFLNGDFSNLPKGLQEILNDENKRKKLVIYINPPYAEAGTGLGNQHKAGVALKHKTKDQYARQLGKATNELFAQFLARIYFEIPNCRIAIFSKLKNLQSSNFQVFRQNFLAKLETLFMAPANTFDNVKGVFPIGFSVWNTEIKEQFAFISADVYDKTATYLGTKSIYSYDDLTKGKINDWLRTYHDKQGHVIGIMHNNKTDFQHNIQVVITSDDNKDHTAPITINNLVQMSEYFAVRKVIEATWLNDRDQFLYPNDGWKLDEEFQNDCLAYTLFNNNIQSKFGVNHWIPFTEGEVNARDKFESSFMTDFIKGRITPDKQANVSLFETDTETGVSDQKRRQFSAEAEAVFDAGRELWKYYHSQKKHKR